MSIQKLRSLLEEITENNSFISSVISSPKDNSFPKKISIRPLVVKEKKAFQFSYQQMQKVVHENISDKQWINKFLDLVIHYKQALICSSSENYQVLFNKKNEPTILRKPATQSSLQNLPHNRSKNYLLQEGLPISFLVELGVMAPSGKIYADKHNKFRQINRFLEMVDDTLDYLPKNQTLQIIDFGCGKAYLTFALYHYLRVEKKYDFNMVGLDLKEDVVEFCQSVADKLGFSHLHFKQGDIQNFTSNQTVDMVISLHACNTATDAALEKAVHWKSKVILAVPCCQHELFKQVECESLKPLLKHGILKERFAALATDASRAQFLEMMGYKTQILEFIDMEHTPKNLLIRAVLQPHKKSEQLIKDYKSFKKLLNITPTIEKMFPILES